MQSDTDITSTVKLDTIANYIGESCTSSVNHLSPLYSPTDTLKESIHLSHVFTSEINSQSPKHARKRTRPIGKRSRHKSSTLSYSSYIGASPVHFQSTSETNTRVQSPISCCSSSFRSTSDISTGSLHYQEVREVTLFKQGDEKFGIKITKIGYSFYISMLISGSPAANAGLKIGDEIIKVNDQSLDKCSNKRLMYLIKTSDKDLRMSFKPRLVIARLRLVLLKKINQKFGLRIQKRSEGIFVVVVVPQSAAHQAGIREGDEIVKINDDHVTEWSQESVMLYLRHINTDDDCETVFYIRQINPVEDYRIISHVQTCRQNCLGAMKRLDNSCNISPYHY